MSKAKPFDFTGAELRHRGGTVKDGKYLRNLWCVTLADGTRIQRDLYHARSTTNGMSFQWMKWYPNKDRQFHLERDGNWRPLRDFDNNAVDKWVKSNIDYYEDNTIEVRL